VVATLTTSAAGLLPTAAGAIATSAATSSTASASGVFDPYVSAATSVAIPSDCQKREARSQSVIDQFNRSAMGFFKCRIQLLLDMLKVNMIINTIHMNPRYSQH
jgi:hypothetical protein